MGGNAWNSNAKFSLKEYSDYIERVSKFFSGMKINQITVDPVREPDRTDDADYLQRGAGGMFLEDARQGRESILENIEAIKALLAKGKTDSTVYEQIDLMDKRLSHDLNRMSENLTMYFESTAPDSESRRYHFADRMLNGTNRLISSYQNFNSMFEASAMIDAGLGKDVAEGANYTDQINKVSAEVKILEGQIEEATANYSLAEKEYKDAVAAYEASDAFKENAAKEEKYTKLNSFYQEAMKNDPDLKTINEDIEKNEKALSELSSELVIPTEETLHKQNRDKFKDSSQGKAFGNRVTLIKAGLEKVGDKELTDMFGQYIGANGFESLKDVNEFKDKNGDFLAKINECKDKYKDNPDVVSALDKMHMHAESFGKIVDDAFIEPQKKLPAMRSAFMTDNAEKLEQQERLQKEKDELLDKLSKATTEFEKKKLNLDGEEFTAETINGLKDEIEQFNVRTSTDKTLNEKLDRMNEAGARLDYLKTEKEVKENILENADKAKTAAVDKMTKNFNNSAALKIYDMSRMMHVAKGMTVLKDSKEFNDVVDMLDRVRNKAFSNFDQLVQNRTVINNKTIDGLGKNQEYLNGNDIRTHLGDVKEFAQKYLDTHKSPRTKMGLARVQYMKDIIDMCDEVLDDQKDLNAAKDGIDTMQSRAREMTDTIAKQKEEAAKAAREKRERELEEQAEKERREKAERERAERERAAQHPEAGGPQNPEQVQPNPAPQPPVQQPPEQLNPAQPGVEVQPPEQLNPAQPGAEVQPPVQPDEVPQNPEPEVEERREPVNPEEVAEERHEPQARRNREQVSFNELEGMDGRRSHPGTVERVNQNEAALNRSRSME